MAEGLGEYIPMCTKDGKLNPKSTMTMSTEEMNRGHQKPSDGKWTSVKEVNNEIIKKKMVAATISIAVEACLKNHCFSQGIQTFLQPFCGVIDRHDFSNF